MPIIGLYAAILAIVFVALSFRVINQRRSLRIAIGDSGSPEMLRAMRVHANFAEYVPLTLVMILLVEMSGARPWLLHILGAALVVGRLMHAYGVSQLKEVFAYRVTGMTITFSVLLTSAAFLVYRFVLGTWN
jgi:uncharacterized membrane protein YecN with MAPEG domain